MKNFQKTQLLLIAMLVFIALFVAFINHPPIVSLWEGTGIYDNLQPLVRTPFIAIQTGGDSEGHHGYGYAFLMISRYLVEIFGQSLFVMKILPILYGLIGALLLYIICNRWFNWRMATVATALLLTNIPFIYFQHSLRVQTITMAAVLFCVERYQKLINKTDPIAIITMGFACALAAMHYIVGRLAMISILLFHIFDPFGYFKYCCDKTFMESIRERLVVISKVVTSMIIFLFLFFPPNIISLFSKNFIFSFMGEYSIKATDLLHVIFYNLLYFINFYIFGNLKGNSTDLMLDLPYPIEQAIVLVFFSAGIFIAIKNFRKVEYRFLLYVISFLFMCGLFCSIYVDMEYSMSSSMMMTRLFLLLPFIAIFAALGIDYLYLLFDKSRRSKILKPLFIMILLMGLAFRVYLYLNEVAKMEAYMTSLEFDFKKPAISKENIIPSSMHDFPAVEKRKMLLNQIYFRELAKYVAGQLKQDINKTDGIKIVYLSSDYYTPDYYRYGGGSIPWKGHKYYFDIYLVLYLRDQGINASYLLKKSDIETPESRIIDKLSKNSIGRHVVSFIKSTFGEQDNKTNKASNAQIDNYLIKGAPLNNIEYVVVTNKEGLKEMKKNGTGKVVLSLPLDVKIEAN